MKRRACKNCEYYSEYDDPKEIGRCHRYPPNINTLHPQVKQADWCGEFSPE